MTLIQKRLATIGALLSMILGIVDTNIVASAAWPIAQSLDPRHGLDSLPWLITAYALATTVTQPLYGKLCDLYGPKRVYLGALAIFLSGSALCGLAQNMGQLIAFRALQGIGGGGLLSVTLIVVMSIWPPKRAEGAGSSGSSGAAGAGMGGVMTGLGIVVGPLAGGLITDHLSWRWIFYVNLPLGVLAWLLAAFNLRLEERRNVHRVDFAGAALIATAASALLLVTEWGGRRYDWGSAAILGVGTAGVVLLVLFLLRQGLVRTGVWGRFAATEPVFPLSLFHNSVFRLASPQQFISGMVTVGSVVYVSLYLQAAQGIKPTEAGLHLLPMAFGMTASSIVAGKLIDKPGRFRPVMVSGMVLVTAALGLLSRLQVDSSTWLVNFDLFLLGCGLGMVLGLALIAVQISAPRAQMGVAITGIRFSQTLGGAVGSALFGTILARSFASNLPAGVGGGDGGGGFGAAQLSTLPPAVQEVVAHAMVKGTNTVFLQAALIAAFAVIITCFFKEPKPATPASAERDAEPAPVG